MDSREIIERSLEALKKAGAEEAQVSLSRSAKSELNVDAGAMSLFRTTMNTQISLTALVEKRKGMSSLNKVGAEDLEAAAREAVELARRAERDEANAIAPKAEQSERFEPSEPDLEAMYARVREFIDYSAKRHPKIRLEQCILDFSRRESLFGNSAGARLSEERGLYEFMAMFTAKDGEKTSSFNYTGCAAPDLRLPLKDWGWLDGLMAQSAEQLETRSVEGKFVGELVVTPHALGDFMDGASQVCLGDFSLISGSSPWKDKLGHPVASPLLSLRSAPRSGGLAAGWTYTGDGFPARDCAVIDKGVLRETSLSLYGSLKTGLPRSPSGGGAWIVEPGSEELSSLIGSVKRGLLLGRISGGSPSDSGDFSGVAKNSYYIEDGKIAYPLSETMIAGNLVAALGAISGISRERVDFGSSLYPWVKLGGITISGK